MIAYSQSGGTGRPGVRVFGSAPVVAGVFALALGMMTAPALADDSSRGYAYDSSGDVEHTGAGDCLRTRSPAQGDNQETAKACGDAADADGDGVVDANDQCSGTPEGAEVDEQGCAIDTDGDGVVDINDDCAQTAPGVEVDDNGCEVEHDSDGDGVADANDECPGTEDGRPVDSTGCVADADNDGVGDDRDICPDTPAGKKVNSNGCEITESADIRLDTDEFEFDSARLKPAMEQALDKEIKKMKATDATEQITVIGYTDSVGPSAYNQDLSRRRAQSVVDYLTDHGIDNSTMTTKGRGEKNPVASNDTKEGRAENRRVVIVTQ